MAKNRLFSEIPPTAGLPPRWRDLLPDGGGDLARRAAGFLDAEQVQVECSGTACLVIALTAMHRLSGRRAVVVPAYTCPLVALAVAYCGLELRICDLAPGLWLLRTSHSAGVVRNTLSQTLERGDRFVVTSMEAYLAPSSARDCRCGTASCARAPPATC